MEIVRARFDVIFDELARLPPLPVAVPVAAAYINSASAWQHGSTSIQDAAVLPRPNVHPEQLVPQAGSWTRVYRRSLAPAMN